MPIYIFLIFHIPIRKSHFVYSLFDEANHFAWALAAVIFVEYFHVLSILVFALSFAFIFQFVRYLLPLYCALFNPAEFISIDELHYFHIVVRNHIFWIVFVRAANFLLFIIMLCCSRQQPINSCFNEFRPTHQLDFFKKCYQLFNFPELFASLFLIFTIFLA